MSCILGLWDGHDAGAALLKGDELLFAINEERLSRRKLEVGFPHRSIRACLDHACLQPRDIREIAASTADPAKTLTRLLPGLKEEYYLIRRRKMPPRPFDAFKKAFKYRFTELAPNVISRGLSLSWMHRRLREMGFTQNRLDLVDHHAAHAAAAAFSSGFPECLVITLDGVGDGACGSLWDFSNGTLTPVKTLNASRSLGIFFEHVTNLMNMRELEDEGKVMALANYAYAIPDDENPLMSVMTVEGLDLVSVYSSTAMFREMKRILWRYPSEQFAAMAQRVLEKCACQLAANALAMTGHRKIAAAGGVFSNIKMNMKIAEGPNVERMAVFPHMGDGGLAIGAAMVTNHNHHGIHHYALPHLALGPAFTTEEVLAAMEGYLREAPDGRGRLAFRRVDSPAETAARLILGGEIILWFQGRMEIGPRSLGNRSILARADDTTTKDRLNLLLKKRVWYQPFCPSMLVEDAPRLLQLAGQETGDNPFMTMAFRVQPDQRKVMEGVINVDGTCRPQFVGDEQPLYRELLTRIKAATGYGVVLNTSFNIHGEPVVCTPREALDMMERAGIRYLVMEGILVENLSPKGVS
jgi:carbamoyltransferase